MKLTKNILLFCIALLMSQLIVAQTAKEVFETNWKGASSSRSDLTDSGYFICTQEFYNITFDESDNTFTGVSKTVFNLDGTDYKYIANVKGTFYESDFSVVIKVVNRIDYDFLPNGMYWIDSDVNLTVYSDENHEGYFILSGKSDGQTYDDELFEVGNSPYF
jgi:hypothetical protein